MPELPEVESFRRRFERLAMHRAVREVVVSDTKVLRGVPPAALAAFLEGQVLVDTSRRGKYFFARRASGGDLHIHLGMTGDIRAFDPHDEWPRFTRVALLFDDGPALAYTDARKFGHLYPVPDADQFLEARGVGPDALELEEEAFLARLRSRRGILKAVLLDQSVLAGLGNLWIDEICLATGIHPGSRIEAIPEDVCRAFFAHMRRMLTSAIRDNPDYHTYPTDALWSWREAGYTFPDGRGPVQTCKLAGRTTCFIPEQVLYQP